MVFTELAPLRSLRLVEAEKLLAFGGERAVVEVGNAFFEAAGKVGGDTVGDVIEGTAPCCGSEPVGGELAGVWRVCGERGRVSVFACLGVVHGYHLTTVVVAVVANVERVSDIHPECRVLRSETSADFEACAGEAVAAAALPGSVR